MVVEVVVEEVVDAVLLAVPSIKTNSGQTNTSSEPSETLTVWYDAKSIGVNMTRGLDNVIERFWYGWSGAIVDASLVVQEVGKMLEVTVVCGTGGEGTGSGTGNNGIRSDHDAETVFFGLYRTFRLQEFLICQTDGSQLLLMLWFWLLKLFVNALYWCFFANYNVCAVFTGPYFTKIRLNVCKLYSNNPKFNAFLMIKYADHRWSVF